MHWLKTGPTWVCVTGGWSCAVRSLWAQPGKPLCSTEMAPGRKLPCNDLNGKIHLLIQKLTLEQRLANIFCKALISKYFSLCRPHSLWGCFSTLLLGHKSSSHRQYVFEQVWLCSDKTLFTNRQSAVICWLSALEGLLFYYLFIY